MLFSVVFLLTNFIGSHMLQFPRRHDKSWRRPMKDQKGEAHQVANAHHMLQGAEDK